MRSVVEGQLDELWPDTAEVERPNDLLDQLVGSVRAEITRLQACALNGATVMVKTQAEKIVRLALRTERYKKYCDMMADLNMSPVNVESFGKQVFAYPDFWDNFETRERIKNRPTVEECFIELQSRCLLPGMMVKVRSFGGRDNTELKDVYGTIISITNSCKLSIGIGGRRISKNVIPHVCELVKTQRETDVNIHEIESVSA